jgi:hypothetical protein
LDPSPGKTGFSNTLLCRIGEEQVDHAKDGRKSFELSLGTGETA